MNKLLLRGRNEKEGKRQQTERKKECGRTVTNRVDKNENKKQTNDGQNKERHTESEHICGLIRKQTNKEKNRVNNITTRKTDKDEITIGKTERRRQRTRDKEHKKRNKVVILALVAFKAEWTRLQWSR